MTIPIHTHYLDSLRKANVFDNKHEFRMTIFIDRIGSILSSKSPIFEPTFSNGK